jgi:hypothetical protein
MSKKIISFNSRLSSEFKKYIESANNICVYKLGATPIVPKIIFPNAKTITLINCNKMGISNILKTETLPNLENVNYLSAHPGDYNIYNRFSDSVKWIFPNKDYDFYNNMVVKGRGKKDENLIKNYIISKKIIDGSNGFDISFEFDLSIPGYGITSGEWWRYQFYEYLAQNLYSMPPQSTNKQTVAFLQEIEELQLEKEIVTSKIENIYFDDMIEDDKKYN